MVRQAQSRLAQLTLLLALFAATIVLRPVAERLELPYPILLLVFGLLFAFVPALPRLDVSPDLILPLVLAPLLFAAARRTSWREFLDNRRAIGLLAVALVAVTTLAAGLVLQALVPGLPLIAAVVLGATVAPPDPVAATAVARQLRLSRRLTTILEGEKLSNDATALVIYEVAVAGTLTGSLSPWGAGGTFALAVVLGIAIGLVIALFTRWALDKLPAHLAGTALVLVMPFVAYVAADAAHGSGVLSVVTLALTLSRYADAETAQTRLMAGTTWEIIELLVTGAAFAFVALELRAVAQDVSGDLSTLITQALIVTGVVIVVPLPWIFPVAWLDEKLHARGEPPEEPVGWPEMTIASWAGMRGVVTLAAALALPSAEDSFPERDRLIFIAFVVIIVTLLLQGLTLPWLVRRLGVQASLEEQQNAERQLTQRALRAGFTRLNDARSQGDVDDDLITANPDPGSAHYLATQGFEHFQLSMFSMVIFAYFGVTQLLYGLATWNSGTYPKWLGAIAIGFGIVGSVVGAVQLLFEISTASITVFVVTWNFFILWIMVMSFMTWRSSRDEAPIHG